MTTAITIAGQSLLTQKVQQQQNLVIDTMVFANISGLVSTEEVDRTETLPAVGDIVGQFNITNASVVNDNAVVFSTVLDSNVGPFDFNWLGLYSSIDSTLVAIAYVPAQTKTATVGANLGNVLTKNFALEFNGAADLTGLTIAAESWQIDYTARLLGMDEISRESVESFTGAGNFETAAFQVRYENDSFVLDAGTAFVRGLKVNNESTVSFDPGALPADVWLDVWQETTLAGIENKWQWVVGDSLTDYAQNSVQHFVLRIATVAATNSITDHRTYVGDNLETWHKGNLKPATTNRAGYVQLNDELTNTSTTQAATPNAIKRVKDIAETAATTAAPGRVQLNDSITSTSTAQAATPNAVKRVKDIAETAATTAAPGRVQLNDSITSTSTTQAATPNAVKRVKDIAETAATTAAPGRVQLNSATNSTSSTQAATPSAVNAVRGIAETAATTAAPGRVQLNSLTNSTSTTQAATPSAVKAAYDLASSKANATHSHIATDLPSATTTAKGVVQLNSAVNSTSTTQAATPSAVKSAYDLASSKANATHSHGATDLPSATTTAKGVVQLSSAVTSTSATLAATASAVKVANDNANSRVPNSEKGAANGVATLDASSKIPMAQMNIPDGGIILWYGLVANIPTGWALCNGANGTPDLRERFVIGASTTLETGSTGGSKAKTTSSDGGHSHTITVNNHTLTAAQMPSHSHSFDYASESFVNGDIDSGSTGSISYSSRNTGGAGSSNSHNHSAGSNSVSNHSHTIDDARPPFYALAYIMKIAA